MIIIKFLSMDDTKAFYHSDEYSKVELLRTEVTNAEIVAANGVE